MLQDFRNDEGKVVENLKKQQINIGLSYQKDSEKAQLEINKEVGAAR